MRLQSAICGYLPPLGKAHEDGVGELSLWEGLGIVDLVFF
jgi:hypothetical protein